MEIKNMDIKDIITLIESFSSAGLSALELEEDGARFFLQKKSAKIVMERYAGVPENGTLAGRALPPQGANQDIAPQMSGSPFGVSQAGAAPLGAQTGTGQAASGTDASPAGPIGSEKVVKSPLVGTFYESSSPEAESFVKAGDTVKKGQVLGLIEAMKLMNEIESEYDGVVEAVLVKNEEFVEYSQPLFRIK